MCSRELELNRLNNKIYSSLLLCLSSLLYMKNHTETSSALSIQILLLSIHFPISFAVFISLFIHFLRLSWEGIIVDSLFFTWFLFTFLFDNLLFSFCFFNSSLYSINSTYNLIFSFFCYSFSFLTFSSFSFFCSSSFLWFR